MLSLPFLKTAYFTLVLRRFPNRLIGRRVIAYAVLCAVFWSIPRPASAQAMLDCQAAILQAAQKYRIPQTIMQAIGRVESKHKPFALNVNGAPYFAKSKADALRHIQNALKNNITSIDIGCMQINHKYHGNNISIEESLNPVLNANYAARFLKQNFAKYQNWGQAVARYHASRTDAQKRYLTSIVDAMAASGSNVKKAPSPARAPSFILKNTRRQYDTPPQSSPAKPQIDFTKKYKNKVKPPIYKIPDNLRQAP
jgi:soluble lytic murein transglycosylase-like protein